MPRPSKPRHVCWLPGENRFGPFGRRGQRENAIIMSVDEYETIRLIDHEDYDQEQAAKQMQVARTTVQRIYVDARKKIAEALVGGKHIIIEGGNYVLCGRNCDPCIWSKEYRGRQRNQNGNEGDQE